MTSAYLLSFALALIPFSAFVVGFACVMQGFDRINAPKGSSHRVPAWVLIAFALYALFLWQWLDNYWRSAFTPSYDDLDAGGKEVLGVTIPFELGEAVFNLFDALHAAVILGSIALGVFKAISAEREADMPKWKLCSLFAVLAVFAWSYSYDFALALESWRYLF